MKNISILGATGSIGQNTLDLISSEKNKFKVVGLTGSNNIDLLAKNAIKFKAEVVATANDSKFHDLKEMLSGHKIEVCAGKNGVLEVASQQADWVMSSIVGSAGLLPGLKALEAGANLALANKESMVAAGPIMKRASEAKGVKLINSMVWFLSFSHRDLSVGDFSEKAQKFFVKIMTKSNSISIPFE